MNTAYYLGWLAARAVFATYFRWRVFHAERVPTQGPVILASNHASFIDPPLVGAGLDRMVTMLARDTLFRLAPCGWLLRAWNAVPVDPAGGSVAGLKRLVERLGEAGAVLIFPEGTRTYDGSLLPARSGVGLVAVKSGAPVIPVRLWGTHKAYGRHMLVPRPRRVIVKYGHAMRFEALRAEATGCSRDRLRAIYQEISEQVMVAIAALQPHWDKATFP